MAILPPKRGSNRRPSMRGNLLQDTTRGVERNRAWPEPRGSRQTRAQREQTDWFRQANWAFKLQDPKTIQMFTDAAAGTSLYPRDIFSIMAAGGLFSLVKDDGKVMYPMQSVLAVSESLDVLSQTPGYTLVRGFDRWQAYPFASERGPWWFDPPTGDDWDLQSALIGQLTLNADPVKGLSVRGPAPQTGDRNAIATRPIPVKSQPWRLTVHYNPQIPAGNFSGCGFYLRDSISGRMTSITVQDRYQLSIINWSTLNAVSSVPVIRLPSPTPMPQHYQIESDGSVLTFRSSPDAFTWVQEYSTPIASWLTNKPDRMGFGVNYNRSSGLPNVLNVDRWLFETDF